MTQPESVDESRDLARRSFSGGLQLLGGTIATNVIRIGVSGVLARLIVPRDYGLVVEATTIIGFIAVFVDLGLSYALVQRKAIELGHEQTAFALSVGFSLVATVVVAGLANWWATVRSLPDLAGPLRVLSLTLIFRTASSVPRMLLSRELRLGEASAAQFGAFLFGQAAISICLGFAGYGAWALAWGAVTGGAIEFVLLFALRPVLRPWKFSFSHARDLLGFGTGFTVVRVANAVALQGDYLVVGTTLGPVALGFYSRAYGLLAIPSSLLESIDGALFPALSRIQDDPERLRSAYKSGLGYVASIVLPFSMITFVLAPEIVAVLLGDRWIGAVAPLRILAPMMFFRTVYKLAGTVARAMGAMRGLVISQILYAAHVVLGAFFGSAWGVEGAAAGVASAIVAQYLILLAIGARLTQMSILKAVIPPGPAILFTTISCAITYAVVEWGRTTGQPPVLRLFMAGVGFLALFVAAWKFAPHAVLGSQLASAADTARARVLRRFLR